MELLLKLWPKQKRRTKWFSWIVIHLGVVPVKYWQKKVFTEKEVGEYFNANFVSIKMDMEKGEGIALQDKYAIKAFPTLLFMDSTGKVLHKVLGSMEPSKLIAEAKKASAPN